MLKWDCSWNEEICFQTHVAGLVMFVFKHVSMKQQSGHFTWKNCLLQMILKHCQYELQWKLLLSEPVISNRTSQVDAGWSFQCECIKSYSNRLSSSKEWASESASINRPPSWWWQPKESADKLSEAEHHRRLPAQLDPQTLHYSLSFTNINSAKEKNIRFR